MLKIKQPDIIMNRKDYIKEHVRLIQILRGGTEEDLKEEAEEQCEELKGRLTAKEFEELDLDD